jgi:hypothetical protein
MGLIWSWLASNAEFAYVVGIFKMYDAQHIAERGSVQQGPQFILAGYRKAVIMIAHPADGVFQRNAAAQRAPHVPLRLLGRLVQVSCLQSR